MPPFRSNLSKILSLIMLATALLFACRQDEPQPVAQEGPVTEATPTALPTLTPFPTAAGPTSTPAATLQPTPTGIPAWFTGVFIDIPNGLGQLGDPAKIEDQSDPSLPADKRFPAHDLYLLNDWPIADLLEQPRIMAFPARDYASVNVHAQNEIEALKSILAGSETVDAGVNLPFLPVKSGPPAFTTLAQTIPSRNANGIRYITWYPSQASTAQPIELIYTWQGLTNDGRGAISAVLPISAPDLPIPPNSDSLSDYELWTTQIATYLYQLAPTDFSPPLGQLDQLVGSIQAQLPEPELLFDTNGKVDLTLVYPRDGGQTIIGQQLEIEGYLQPGIEQTVELFLLSGDKVIAGQTIISSLDGWYRASLPIPLNVQGTMQLQAISGSQSTAVELNLVDNPKNRTESIRLDRPIQNQTAVANFPIYFEGSLNTPLVNDTLSIGLAIDNCQTVVATQDITLLPSDTAWHGVLQIPATINGTACALVWTGEYGESGWREVQVPLDISDQPPSSADITLGNPQNVPLLPGQLITIYGSAFSPANSSGSATIFTKDESFKSDVEFAILENGLWSFDIHLPAEATGRLFLEFQFPNNDSFSKIHSLPIQTP